MIFSSYTKLRLPHSYVKYWKKITEIRKFTLWITQSSSENFTRINRMLIFISRIERTVLSYAPDCHDVTLYRLQSWLQQSNHCFDTDNEIWNHFVQHKQNINNYLYQFSNEPYSRSRTIFHNLHHKIYLDSWKCVSFLLLRSIYICI